jgi:hypothetical protein
MILRTANWFLKRDGRHEGYQLPQDLEAKLEQILKHIGRRIFEYSWPSRNNGVRKINKKNESYDYAHKHYILIILLNFKYHIGNGWFNFKNYHEIIERNMLEHGHLDYKAAGITEESVDKIIRVYKERIFEYPKNAGRGEGHDGKIHH